MYTIRPLTRKDAVKILAWRYAPPYHVYNMADHAIVHQSATLGASSEEIAFLLDPENGYFAVDTSFGPSTDSDDEAGRLFGYCCFGPEGQVPGYDYTQQCALDIGAGMDPEETGQGQGNGFLRAILDFGRQRFAPTHFRATVAVFNQRSQAAITRLGFEQIDEFVRPGGSAPTRFRVFLRNE